MHVLFTLMVAGLTAPPTLRALRAILETLPEASHWQQEAGQSAALQASLVRALPAPLAASCAIRLEDDGTAVLACPSGVVAARLRQIAPRLMHQLGAEGLKIMAIRVEVQPSRRSATPLAPPRPLRKVPPGAADGLEALAAGTRPGGLADALRRLAARLREQE